MTVLCVEHVTTYRYQGEVNLSQHLLRLAPRAAPGQTVLSHRLVVDPKPDELMPLTDFFGNASTVATLQHPHSELSITARSRVRRTEPPDLILEASAPWERAAASAREPAGLAIAPFAHPGAYTRADAAIEDYARASFPPGTPVLAGARDLSSRIHADFAYAPGTTDASTRPVESFSKRRGVCQDFAHVMLAGLRALGLSARYVSGYLRTHPPEGRPALVGADASHAWVSVWDPGLGWVDFDPTNDLIPGTEHITLCWGRDFADVSPIAGIVIGSGEQGLSVGVTVTEEA